MNFIVHNESTVRLSFFAGGLFTFWIMGLILPFRNSGQDLRSIRWSSNLILTFGNSLLIKVIAPLSLVEISNWAATHNYGLFNLLQLPAALNLLLSIFVFDAIIYWQHRLTHIIPLFWRLHRVHHTDIEFDVTTASRFHPIEILLSFAVKMLFVVLLGANAAGIILFEVILNFSAMFNHGNYSLSPGLEKIVRFFIVTPDMHRVHHSVLIRETNSNFGFNFPWWDRLFGTYRAQPVAGHEQMTIGLSQFRKAEQVTLLKLLMLPFTGEEGRYSLKYIGKDPTRQKRDDDNVE